MTTHHKLKFCILLMKIIKDVKIGRLALVHQNATHICWKLVAWQLQISITVHNKWSFCPKYNSMLNKISWGKDSFVKLSRKNSGLQCDRENREHLKYVRSVISDQSHPTNLLAKPQSVFRYSAKPVAAWDFQNLAPLVVDSFKLPAICFSETDK